MIRELDLKGKVALAERTEINYYTQPKEETNLWVDEELNSREMGKTCVRFGRVTVENTIRGFQKKRAASGEVLGFEELDLPPGRFSTEAFWCTTPTAEELGLSPYAFAGGLHALEHTAIALLPVYAMCDRWDVGGISTPLHPELGAPAVFVYDGYAGGIGIALRGFTAADELLDAVLAHLRSCPCGSGCPSCVQSPKCGKLNEPLDKTAAVTILKSIL